MTRPQASGAAHDALMAALPATVDTLHRRRASEIPEGFIDAYVALQWLEWHGGGLRVTETGQNVCRQLRLRMTGESPEALASSERAELSRQGAKAAARGESAAVNPLGQGRNLPGSTGETQDRWSERSAAWHAGYDFERGKTGDKAQR